MLNKERQADVGFGSSQTQMIKNIFTVAPTLVKLLGSMAHNVQGLAMLGDLKIVRPEPLMIEKQMYKISCKSPPMFVLPEQLLPCC